MRTIRTLATLAVLVVACAELSAQTAGSLLVLSKRDHTLAIVNPDSLQVVAKLPVGDDPHEVIASADGTRAYVSNYGFGAFHTLAVLDLPAKKPLPSVDLGALHGPHGLTVQGGKVWFTAEAAKAFGRYDPATQKVDLILGTGQNRTHMIWVSSDGQEIVTTNVSSGTVSIFKQEPLRMPGPPPGSGPHAPPPGAPPMARTDWNETVVRVGNGSEGFDVSPSGQEAWVANAQDGTISIVNLEKKVVTQTLQVKAQGANRLKFTIDGALVLISSGPELVVIDTATKAVRRRIQIGHGSGGVLIEPSGKRAFIACGPDDNVAIVDLASLQIVGHIQAGGEPDGMAWVGASVDSPR